MQKKEHRAAIGPELKKKWAKGRRKAVLQSIVAIVIGGLMLVMGLREYRSLQSSYDKAHQNPSDVVIEEAIKGPKYYLNFLVIVVGALSLAYGSFSTIQNGLELVRGGPRPGGTPEKTARRFLALWPSDEPSEDQWIDTFVCITEQQRSRLGGLDNYIVSYTAQKASTKKRLEELVEPRIISRLEWDNTEPKVVKAGPAKYSLDARFNIKIHGRLPGLSSSSSVLLGSVKLSLEAEMVEIDELWYLDTFPPVSKIVEVELVGSWPEFDYVCIYDFLRRSALQWGEGTFDFLSDYYGKAAKKYTVEYLASSVIMLTNYREFLAKCYQVRKFSSTESFLDLGSPSISYGADFILTSECLYLYDKESSSVVPIPLRDISKYEIIDSRKNEGEIKTQTGKSYAFQMKLLPKREKVELLRSRLA